MVAKNSVRFVLIVLFIVSMFGCVQTSLTQKPTDTQMVLITDTPVEIPTSIPSPTSTPAYAYLPIISAINGTEIVKFDRYDGAVSSLAFSPNGKCLAATFENGAGIIWDISTVKYWREWQDAPKDVFFAKGQVSFNSDSSILATGGTLLELPSKKVVQELSGTVAFNPISQTFALADWNIISFWSLDGMQWTSNYKQESQGVVSVAFSPDGSLLGEALYGGEGVNLWRVCLTTHFYTHFLRWSITILLILISSPMHSFKWIREFRHESGHNKGVLSGESHAQRKTNFGQSQSANRAGRVA